MNTSRFDRSEPSFEEGQSSRTTRSMSRTLRENAEKNEVNISTAFKLQNSNDSLRARFPGYTTQATTTTKTKTTITSKKYSREAFISRQTQVNRLKYKPMIDGSSSEEDDTLESSFTSVSSSASTSNSLLPPGPRVQNTPLKTPGIGQRLVNSIVTNTPQWIRGSFSSARPTKLLYRNSPIKNRKVVDDESADETPNTLYMMAGRYHLESGDNAGINLARNSDDEVELGTESSEESSNEVDSKHWQPGVANFAQYRPAPKSKKNIPVVSNTDEELSEHDSKHYMDYIHLEQGPGFMNNISLFLSQLWEIALKLCSWIQNILCLAFTIVKDAVTSFDWSYPLRLLLSGLSIGIGAVTRGARILHRKLGSFAPLFYLMLLLGLIWTGMGDQKRDEIYQQVGNTRDTIVHKAYDTRDIFVNKAYDTRDVFVHKAYDARDQLASRVHVAKEELFNRAHNAKNKFDVAKENIYNHAQDVQYKVANRANEAKNGLINKVKDTREGILSKAYDTRDRIVSKAQDTWQKGHEVMDRVKAKIPKPTEVTLKPSKENQSEEVPEKIIEEKEEIDEIVVPEIPHSDVANDKSDDDLPSDEDRDHDQIGSIPRINWSVFSLSSFHWPELSWPKVNLPTFQIPTFSVPHIPIPQLPELPSVSIRELIPFDWFKNMLSKIHLPTIEFPEFTLHNLLPEFNWPAFEFAKLNIPKFQVPELNWPVFQLPKLNFPKFDLPSFSLPQMNLPEFSLPSLPQFDLSAWSLSNLLPEFSWPDFSRLNPFSSEPIPVRRAPSSKTISEFHNRLAELEASIRDLAIVASVLMDESETIPLPGSHTSLSREKLISDLSNIRRKLKSELEIASVQQEVIQSLAGTIASREKELTAIEHQVEGMRSDVKFVDSQVQESDQSIEKVYNHLSQLNNELARASDWNTVKKQVIKTLESELPNHLVAQQSEDGSIILSSEFYAHLVRSLLTKDQADRLVAEEIENQKQHIPSHDHKLRWTEFFGANKHQLSHLVQRDLEDEVKRYTDIGVIVHKDDFLSVVESHLEELKLRLSSHVDMDVAIVEKEMEKELEITHQEREERKRQYRQSVRLIEEMIQNSLVKYTADTIARPDFALYYSGARVVTELTSPSYLPQSGSTFDKFAQILGMNTLKYGNPPAMAMYPDTHLGKCWAFSGTQGQLTIQLSRTINATDFTIEHVDQQVAIDLRSAPKELEVYGLVANSGDEDEPKNFEEFLLARYEYDTAQNRIQTFSVDPHQKVYKPVKYVQLRVLSNHGHPDFTCIYRFRVHGKLSNE